MIIAGNRIYDKCELCGKLVQVNKRVFGDLHFCLSPEERAQRARLMQEPYNMTAFDQQGFAARKRKGRT